jgi:hypothetical protein
MNVSRGLSRAWILISIIWIGIAAAIGYGTSDFGAYQPRGVVKAGVTDTKKALYEVIRSPSAENLSVKFLELEWSQETEFDKDKIMIKRTLPDGSRLFMHMDYNEQDRGYIEKQFWDQRWSRWAPVAGVTAMWALIPPIMLLILGYALMWVGRGFAK